MVSLDFVFFILYLTIIFWLLTITSTALPKFQKQTNLSTSKLYAGFYIVNLVLLFGIFGINPVKCFVINLLLLFFSHIFSLKMRIFAITGSPSSGKSQIGKYLEKRYKCYILNLDEIYYEFFRKENLEGFIPRGIISSSIYERILLSEKRIIEYINKKYWFKILLKIIFTVIREKFFLGKRYVFISCSILMKLETLVYFIYPIFSVISTHKSVIVRRLIEKHKCTQEIAEDLIKKYPTPEQIQINSDFWITNEKTIDEVHSQLDKLMELLRIG